eukprot:NODE_9626_length_1410_cov_4.678098.p1 GENE.NODE_9626_length_1410_cov_4.678098~~NODE_9626_length_1410_cov_4.678098.p1  ORF type:complete len:279 (+),score=88.03 NODE_9626_length_1410_cov_4.678098:287-1123(+)
MSVALADALRVSYVCHGDDLPQIRGAAGMYTEVMDAGRFQMLRRTEAISTTNIVERLLQESSPMAPAFCNEALCTVERLSLFATPADPWVRRKRLREAQRVVYIDGTFDILHSGHIGVLEKAAAMGDYLLVGLHTDAAVTASRGVAPVLSTPERALGVLSLRCVDDVMIDAPWIATRELFVAMNVSVVVGGIVSKTWSRGPVHAATVGQDLLRPDSRDVHAAARALGIYVEVDSGSSLTMSSLRSRFLERRKAFVARNAVLRPKELNYVSETTYVPEV